MPVSFHFCDQVYTLVRQIPPGRVATYGQIALLLGNPRMSRAVGHALSVCQDDSVPCHRVVNRLGGLSDAFSPFGRESHRLLLALEEVPFTPEGRADLSRCLWQGPQIPSNLT